MLKRILLTLITFFTLGNLVSQCVTDTTLINTYLQARSQTWGFMPDTLDNLPAGYVNSLYDATIQVKWDTNNPNVTSTDFKIIDVIGLPPGMTFISDSSISDNFYCDGQGVDALNCKWYDNEYGCFNIKGTPITSGNFPLTIRYNVGIVYSGTYLHAIATNDITGYKITVNQACVNYSDTLHITNSICQGDSLFFNNSFIKNTGKYYDSTTYGTCDSVIELNLIEVDYRDTVSVSACDSIMSASGNYSYTANGTYSDTLPSALGCDSIIVINLTLGKTYTVLADSVCSGDSVLFGGNYIKNQGVYYDTITLIGGCDSIIEINLTVNSILNTNLSSVLCNGDSLLFSGSYIKTQGMYYDTLTSSLGCDSIIELNLTISNDSLVVYDTISSGTYQSAGGYFYITSGVYYESYLNQYNCDSVVKLDLLFYQDTLCGANIKMDSVGTNYYLLSFDDSSVTSFDTVWWEISHGGFINQYYGDSILVNFIDSGVHTIDMIYIIDIMGGSPFCTSVDSIYMSSSFVNCNYYRDTIIDTNCYSFQSPSGNYYYSSGIYYDTVISNVGCDTSVYVLNYYIKQSNQNFIYDTVCGNYISSNGNIYTTSGAYEELYETQTNCYWDSLWLVITPGNGGAYFYFNQNTPNVIQLVDSSYGTDLSYKWSWGDGTYDSAVTTPSHTYANTGLYEVCLELTDTLNGCKYYYCDSLDIDSNGLMRSAFTLNVIRIETVGITENILENTINLYPNPTQNELWIESEQEMISFKILSISGKLITESSLSGKKSAINISDIANGYYLIGVKTKTGILYKRIAISK